MAINDHGHFINIKLSRIEFVYKIISIKKKHCPGMDVECSTSSSTSLSRSL